VDYIGQGEGKKPDEGNIVDSVDRLGLALSANTSSGNPFEVNR
jgi:hypothetical protein